MIQSPKACAASTSACPLDIDLRTSRLLACERLPRCSNQAGEQEAESGQKPKAQGGCLIG
jgi:hypothetical protein